MKLRYLITLLVILVFNCNHNQTFEPPRLEKQKTINYYFGNEVVDNFRHIENTQDSTIIKWYRDQTLYSNSFLKRIHNRESLIEKLYEIDNRKSYFIKGNFTTENDNRFYRKKGVDDTYYKLYYKKAEDNLEHQLYDPRDYKKESGNVYSINYTKPSWDEKYIVVSLSHSGLEISELIIIETSTKRILPVTLTNAWPASFLGINWLPDNSGFTYLYFPDTNPNSTNFKRNSQSVLYKLGQNPNDLNYIFGNKTNPKFNILPSDYPTTEITSSSSKYIIGYMAGVDNYWRAYFAKIEDIKTGELNWKEFYSPNEKIKVSNGIIRNENYFFMSAVSKQNFEIASVDINNLDIKNPKIHFSPPNDEVINNFRVTKNAIYVTTTKFGIEAFFYQIINDDVKKMTLPKTAGRINLSAKSVNYDDIWISLSGWTSSNERYRYELDKDIFVRDNLSESVEYPEFNNIVAEQIMVKSHDGVMVPLSIIYDKTKKTKNSPTIIEVYGAYGDSTNPYFSPLILGWVAEGGVFCTAHVRGGGEKGEDWHQGGLKVTKPNSWKDLIACSEYMISKEFTTKKNLAIYGSSAGGIIVGRAMTERPDLFAAVISEYGVLNPIRMETQPGGGGSNIKEFGTVTDSIECMALIEMDAYLHIKDNIDYPATYLTVGMNDPRVVPWESGKFAARLQNSNTLKKPIFLSADFDSGHEGNQNSDKKIYEEWGNVFTFVFWQTGHPDYQLRKN